LVSELVHQIIGALREGAAADLIVSAIGTNTIRHVLVDGAKVVENGILRTGDIDAIRGEAQREAARLWDRMTAL
jgi:adenine deaminase